MDAALLVLAAWVAFMAWTWHSPALDVVVRVRFVHIWLPNPWVAPLGVLVPLWLLLLRNRGFYDPGRSGTLVRTMRHVTGSTATVLVVVVTLQFLLGARGYSRMLVLSFLGLGFCLLGSGRAVLLRLQERWPLAVPAERVAIFGVGPEAELMAQRLARLGRGWSLAGFIAPNAPHTLAVPDSQILGDLSGLVELVNDNRIETVVLATRRVERPEALVLARRLSQMGLRVLQVPFTWGVASPRLEVAELGSLQLIDLSTVRYPTLVEAAKRAFDLVFVGVVGLLIAPMLAAVALAVKLDSKGPVFYAAPRMGRGGRSFPFYKFRSMVQGADQARDQLPNEADGPLFKMTQDPRVTRVGQFIRKTSLDEFPQFWNVLRGDMNLVGPRPLPLEDLANIEPDDEIAYWMELRHQVRPGITGLWQVMGRSDLGFQEMVRHDLDYIQNWSPWLDLKILLLTVPAVLRGRGAR
jgi:exopolysaccharide biosynthesis polyprenyl glycosylphosphotransferase